MKSIKKTNIYYMALIIFYMFAAFLVSLFPIKNINVNFSLLLGELIILIPTLAYLAISKFRPIRLLQIKPISISNILIIILLTYLCMPLLSLLNYISMFFVHSKVTDMFQVAGTNPLGLNLLLIAVVPAVVEELVFRGILFHSYRRNNILRAGILSAFLFGLMHLNVNQFLYAFAMGIIFAFVIEATGSIFSSMLMHFIINANSVMIYYMYGQLKELAGDELKKQITALPSDFAAGTIIYLVVMALIGLILAALVYYWLCYRNGTVAHIRNITGRPGRKVFNLEYGRIFSIPLIIGIIICICYIIYNDFVV